MTEQPLLVGRIELAKIIGISTRRLDCWRKSRELPEPQIIAGRPYWKRSEVLAYFQRQAKGAAA